MRIFIRRLLAS
ncbi:hypothetical protein YPPY54_1398, partial [Yersinia pestis PY-54]